MSSPYMNKDRVRDAMLVIESLVHYLEKFLESDGEDFYDKIAYTRSDGKEADDDHREEMIEKMTMHNLIGLDRFNKEIIPYLRTQSESYITYLN